MIIEDIDYTFSINDLIGLRAITQFLVHSKKCRKCGILYNEFLNETMDRDCFKKYFEKVEGCLSESER